MIWMSWRQFRTQALVASIAVAIGAGYLVQLGLSIRRERDAYLDQCTSAASCTDLLTQLHGDYSNLTYYLNGILMLVPFLIGLFWGAPLIAKEFESGTHRLIWNQSITRRRWFGSKLLFIGAAAVLCAAGLSLLLTWATSPLDQIADERLTRFVFGARHIVPIAHTVFALVLGTVIGIFIRRTVPAMAVTLLALLAVQIGFPQLVRPHLISPIHVTVPMTAETLREDTTGLGSLSNQPTVKGFSIDDAWVASTTHLRTSSGQSLDTTIFDDCIFDRYTDAVECLADLDLHIEASYHPNDRYWSFQALESGVYLGAAFLLAGLGGRRLRTSVG
jgi:ABC-type transport system involved in multi-copper enzyme maturation permease subunit